MTMEEALRKAGFQVTSEPDRRDEVATQAICTSCGNTFRPRESHHRICYDCFRQRRSPTARTGQARGGGQRPREQSSGGTLPRFPNSYFAVDSEGNQYLDPIFVSKKTINPLAENMSQAYPRLTNSQMRRFFNECRQIERLLKVEGKSWSQVAYRFEKLTSHAQYAQSGQNSKIPREFREFIDRNVSMVTNSDESRTAFLDGFMQHFEALVGFGAYHMRD